ncbi:hypothetical protein BBJ28_00000546 [Nothophytophthora sp. Chile5]|nr:hypothetical protein BBJ28_00000546 [Nothophytophthora sp. Chile5]
MTSGLGDGSNAATEKDALASWDTQLYISLSIMHYLCAMDRSNRWYLQKEKRERLASKARNSVVSISVMPVSEGVDMTVTEARTTSPSKGSHEAKPAVLIDEVQFSMQKLKRELADLKSANAKLMLTNSQLEDDWTHLQAKFDDEKRAHLNGKKWFMPKLQKLEEVALATGKAFEEVKLSVELMTNMYKDNERKDRLLTLAMAARYEMVQHATRQEEIAKEASEQRTRYEVRALHAEEEVAAHKQQLEDAYTRLEATNAALVSAKESIRQLQGDVRVGAQAAAAKESELLAAFEKQQTALQQKLDKAKRELMEAVSETLNLDSRLRKAQEKLTKQTTGYAG